MHPHSPLQAWREGVIHPAYVRIALSMAERLGLQPNLRLPETGRLASLMDVIPLLDQLEVAANPYLGIDLGSLISASAHGAMGYAVVSSATVGQAMHTLARYASMRNRFFQYRCHTDAHETCLTISPRIPLGVYADFCEIGTAVSIFKMIQSVAGDEAAAHMHFEARWEGTMPLPVPMRLHYRQPHTALRVPLSVSCAVPPTADAKLYASACRSCEEELAAIDGSLASRLRATMPNDKEGWPTLTTAAQRLAMSPRTLIRRLSAEGVTFQSLIDDAKSELARWYLTNTDAPVSAIAERLGFVDDTNFSRSFRRWHQMTPMQFRQTEGVRVHTKLNQSSVVD